MKAKLIALNLLLAAGVGAVVWQARIRVQEAELVRRAHLGTSAKPVPPPPIAPAPKPEQPSAIRYEDVAKKNLFSADRNDDIVVEAPKIVPPKPMPPLPLAYGVMTLASGSTASMAVKAGEPPRMVHIGDSVGEFRIAALDAQNVTFDWDGKQIQRRIEDLMDRSGQPMASNASAPQGGAAGAGPAAPPPQPAGPAKPGVVLTETTRACVPGDTTPAGTVADGFKKVATQSIFGVICRWVKQ